VTFYVIAFVLLVAALAWFFLGGNGDAPEPTARRHASDDIDHAELEEAEREVRHADDEESVSDWGPGAPRRPPDAV
jgi:hypothetical protein